MQYKREEVRDMKLYGEILKKLEGTPCLALERSFVGEEGNLADMRCELKESAEASEIGKEAAGLWARRKQLECGGTIFSERAPDYSRRRPCGSSGGRIWRARRIPGNCGGRPPFLRESGTFPDGREGDL